MPGRQRLPGGEPRKASQRYKRNLRSAPGKVLPTWRLGDRMQWKGRIGTFRRDIGDGEHAEVVIEGRVYRVRIAELS